jgi:hypothetical protein
MEFSSGSLPRLSCTQNGEYPLQAAGVVLPANGTWVVCYQEPDGDFVEQVSPAATLTVGGM